MAITFIGSHTASAVSGADASLNLNTAGAAAGDLAIVAYAIGDNDSVDFNMAMISGGYTEVVDIHAPTDIQDCDLGVFWKFVVADDLITGLVTVDGLGGADASVAAVLQVFRGVDATTPMDVAPTTASGNNSNIPDPPSIDHLNPSGVWTVIAGAFGHTGGGAVGGSFPTGYVGQGVIKGEDDTSDITVFMAYRTNPGDPENPGVFTPTIADNANHSWCAATLALRPASVADTLSPSAIASAEAFGTAKVNFTLFPSAIASLEAFGTLKSNFKLFPSAIASAEANGTPQVNLVIRPNALASAEAFGVLTLIYQQFVTPVAIASTEAFGSQRIILLLAPSAIASAEAFGTLQVNRTLPAGSIASAEAFGSSKVNFVLAPSAIASAESHGTPQVNFVLRPSGLVSAEAFGTQKINFVLFPGAVASAEAFGTANITEGAQLVVPSSIASLEAFGTHKVNFIILPPSIEDLTQLVFLLESGRLAKRITNFLYLEL